jgi:hypothetical protein
MSSKKNNFVKVKLRLEEIKDIVGVYEFIKFKNGSSSQEGKLATKIINRLKKHLDED